MPIRERSEDDAHGLSLSLSHSLSPPSYFPSSSPRNVSALRLDFSPPSPCRGRREKASLEIAAPLVTTYNVLTLLLELLITVITGA